MSSHHLFAKLRDTRPATRSLASAGTVTRRRVCALLLGATLASVTGAGRAAGPPPLRIGTTAVILDDQVTFLNAWKAYLERRLDRPVQFVQRGSYREITELLMNDQLDFAWVCGYPYVRNRPTMKLLAIPLFRGKPLYQSYLIVPASDTTTHSFSDLEGAVFAYSDPNSNSGYLVPQFEMLRRGIEPSNYYRKTFYTWAHRKVVAAVAARLAEAGAVDGYVWETLALIEPRLTSGTRVAAKSDEYGFPPIVARASIAPRDFKAFQTVLLHMPQDDEGRALLRQLNLDGFAPDDTHVFDGIARIIAFVGARQRLAQQ
jgi:phosphonate transport system substrate-binding protein